MAGQDGSSARAAVPEGGVWAVIYIGGSKAGYRRTAITKLPQDGRSFVRVEGLTHMVVPREGKPTTSDATFTALETPEGELLEFEVESTRGTQPTRTTGRVVGDKLQLEIATFSKTESMSLPWSSEYGGFLAVEQSLLAKPMKPGESRVVRALVPEFNTVATNLLTARDHEATKLLTATPDLLRIDTETTFPDTPNPIALRGSIWTDVKGEILKDRLDAMSIESYRTTRDDALKGIAPGHFDLVLDVKVELDRPLKSPHQTKRVRYRVKLEDDDPAAVFVSGASQRVESIDPHTAEVTVFALHPDYPPGNPDAADDPPTDDDRRPNNLIQSDYPAIVAKARQIAADVEDPWQAAVALERSVGHVITTRGDYSQAFATAAEVIGSGRGDCTEHAVLLAALARAKGIPARVAIGLVYVQRAFYYHMWTEVYVADRWIPLDATRARGGIDAAYLKMTHSNLSGASALASVLPVLQVIGQLQIEVLDAQ